jgi:hypothetical protein
MYRCIHYYVSIIRIHIINLCHPSIYIHHKTSNFYEINSIIHKSIHPRTMRNLLISIDFYYIHLIITDYIHVSDMKGGFFSALSTQNGFNFSQSSDLERTFKKHKHIIYILFLFGQRKYSSSYCTTCCSTIKYNSRTN